MARWSRPETVTLPPDTVIEISSVSAATMFAWTKIPEPFTHLGSLEFSKLLVEKADVAVSPGVGFGEHGDEYVRIALVENEHRIRQAARNIKKFFAEAGAEGSEAENVIDLNSHR